MFDISFVTGVPVKKIKGWVLDGENRIKFAIFCHDLLDRLRERNARQRHCPKCGVLRSSNGPCINQRQCETRVAVADSVISQSFLNIPERPLTKPDVFLLLHYRQEVEKAIAERNKLFPDQPQHSFLELVGVPENLSLSATSV